MLPARSGKKGIKVLSMLELIFAINAHKCVATLEILEFVDETDLMYLKTKAVLIDGSILHIREVVTPNEDKYSYHWQSSEDRLLRRWDNAPHWPELETYPHHVHVGREDCVEPSRRVTIIDVLNWIYEQCKT